MKIITEAGIEINEREIDAEYAKNLIRTMVRLISTQSVSREMAIADLGRMENYIKKEKEWQETLALP